MKKARMILLISAAVVLLVLMIVLLLQPKGNQPAPSPSAAPTQSEGATQSGAQQPAVDADTASQAVVLRYLDRWNARDTDGMDACLIPADRGLTDYSDIPLAESVTVHELQSRPAEEAASRFDPSWYENPADVALVIANFTVTYNDQGKETYLRDGLDHTDYQFWLVQDTQNGQWYIVMQGY